MKVTRMNFENSPTAHITQGHVEAAVRIKVERGLAATEVLKHERKRPDPLDFIDVYSEKDIKRDLDKVAIREKQFVIADADLRRKDPRGYEELIRTRKMGKALEVIFSDQVDMSNWLGPFATVVHTSKADDILNGVDAVLEFSQESKPTERLALAVDASRSPRSISDKLLRNTDNLLGVTGSHRPQVKYYESKTFPKGTLYDVVPVVVGLSGENCDRLVSLFGMILKIQETPGPQRTDVQKNNMRQLMQQMETHPAQVIFLKEIQMQLAYYLRRLNAPLPQTARPNVRKEKIIELLKIVDGILDDKETIQPDEQLKQDAVYQAIEKATAW